MLDGVKHVPSGSCVIMQSLFRRLPDSVEHCGELDHRHRSIRFLSLHSLLCVGGASADSALPFAESRGEGEEVAVVCLL